MNNHDQRAEATVTVKAKLGFYIHFVVYLLVNALLITLDLSLSPDHIWFQWPLLGWGAGILLHAILAFLVIPRARGIRERMIQREMKNQAKARP